MAHLQVQVRNDLAMTLTPVLTFRHIFTRFRGIKPNIHLHCERVARNSFRFGEVLGLLKDTLIDIHSGARLHDIGKIGIPDSVLDKETSLTDDEKALIRQHPTIGCEMLIEVDVSGIVTDIIQCHHEQWDGQGYPNGLKGTQIPICARMVAITDALDVLHHGRPYSDPMPVPQALKRIADASGSKFDPALVEFFVRWSIHNNKSSALLPVLPPPLLAS